jgi:hypothetical protein
MDKVKVLKIRVEDHVTEIYELGKEEGYEEGWNEAKLHFRVPDL